MFKTVGLIRRPCLSLRAVSSRSRCFHDFSAPGAFRYVKEPRTVTIIGAPLADGQPLGGVELGPRFIREGGLVERLRQEQWRVDDQGDLDFHSISKSTTTTTAAAAAATTAIVEEGLPKKNTANRIKFANIVGPANKMIFDSVGSALEKGHLPVVLGGDHSIGIGSMSAVLRHRPDTGIIWVDAHADINTPSGSASGNIHGMVLSFLMNLERARETCGFSFLRSLSIPALSAPNLVYIGLRDVDGPERALIRSLNIRAYTMKDIDRYGIARVMEMAQEHLLNRVMRPIHLSFDIDSLDPAYAPSTGTRVSGGLSYREAYYICESVAETGMLSSMDLAEVNPELTSSNSAQTDMTVKLAVGLISSALGNTIL